jgi:oligoribonuclease
VWIDTETTGLDYQHDTIIQIACIITDFDLNIKAKSQEYIIHKSQEIMDGMGEWCKNQHVNLTKQVLKSQNTLEFVKVELLNFIKDNSVSGSYLAGNSVHFDKCFLQKEMSEIIDHLGYQIIDVTSFKLMVGKWYSNYEPYPKKYNHTAMDDISESINELKYLKEKYLV